MWVLKPHLINGLNMKMKISIVVLFIITAIYFYRHFVINLSSSEPLGIYKIWQPQSIQRDDVVAVCLSGRYQKIGLSKGYLIPGIRCKETAPLIKTVIAIPGDTVILGNNKIIVDGKVYPCTTKYFDSHGRKLEVFPRGVYRDTNAYWLIGTNSPNSWDSRYWGGVDRKQILSPVSRIF
jgi:conjugative transfer signal peptidase TraF